MPAEHLIKAMADSIIKISKLNALFFHLLDKTQADQRYNTYPIGDDAYWFQIKSYEAKRPFAQKWQFNDNVQVQINVDHDYGSSINLVDKYGTIYHTWNTYNTYSISGNVFESNNVSVPLTTLHFNFSFADASVPAGVYWLKLNVPIDTDESGSADMTIEYLSLPILLATKHNDTILLEYKHQANKYDTVFAQTDALFSLRLEAFVNEFEPISSDISYKDQVERVRLLSSFPSEQYKLTIGGNTGIPDHLYNIINRVFSCSEIYLDGVQITKDEGAKWETLRTAHNPLKHTSIGIRYVDDRTSSIFVKRNNVFLFTTIDYPYFIHTATLSDGVTTLQLPIKVIDNSTDETTYLALLNGIFKTSNSLGGQFLFANNTFYYKPAPNEHYFFNGFANLPVLLGSYFSITKTVLPSFLDTFSMSVTGDYIGVSWVAGNASINKYGNGAYSTFTATHIYPNGTPPVTMRVFHRHNIYGLSVNHSRVTAFSGNMSWNLQDFTMVGFNSSSFDMSLFANNLNTLRKFYLTNGETATLPLYTMNYNKLIDIDISDNKLASAEVDNILNAMSLAAYNNNTQDMALGTLHLEGQTPAAAPGAGGIAAKNYLLGLQWTIYND